MNNRVPFAIASLLLLTSVAFAAESTPSKSDQTSVCMVANGCVQHTEKNIKAIDTTVSALDTARNSKDPKQVKAAIELAYKSLSEVRADEQKNERAMKALHAHLTKVEELAARLKTDQSALTNLLNGDGLDAQFIITD